VLVETKQNKEHIERRRVSAGASRARPTPSAGSVPKFVAQKPDSVEIRSKFTADRNSFPRMDQIDKLQGARADHWRGW
jgi:hypothetical protein